MRSLTFNMTAELLNFCQPFNDLTFIDEMLSVWLKCKTSAFSNSA